MKKLNRAMTILLGALGFSNIAELAEGKPLLLAHNDTVKVHGSDLSQKALVRIVCPICAGQTSELTVFASRDHRDRASYHSIMRNRSTLEFLRFYYPEAPETLDDGTTVRFVHLSDCCQRCACTLEATICLSNRL